MLDNKANNQQNESEQSDSNEEDMPDFHLDEDGDLVAELIQFQKPNTTDKVKHRINEKEKMEAKLFIFKKNRNFIEVMDITTNSEFSYEGRVDDDFSREAAFLKQAQAAVCVGLPKLKALNVPIFRPDDYFAEMAKSDQHMQKVRKHINSIQKDKEERETSRRLREEKKFALKVQKNVEERKRKEKKKLLEVVKKHRKGMKDQFDAMVNNASNMDIDDGNERAFGNSKKVSRSARNQKFGFGGKKKNKKRNDKNSFENLFSNRKKIVGKNKKIKRKN